jgi:phage/plasmid-like protein (TIGR03299 family)
MPDQITINEDGFAEAAFSMTPGWHGLGEVLGADVDSEEMILKSRLGWNVVQRPVAVGSVIETDHGDPVDYDWKQIPNQFANVRDDNGFVLGMVTDRYKLVQNREAFSFLDKLVEDHEMRYESAFSLSGGKRVVVLAQMPGVDTVVEGDEILRYILLSLAHDGTAAIRFGPTAIRVVCANTYRLAVDQGTTKELVIRHTGNIEDKLGQARDILGIASDQFNQYAEVGRQLAKRRLARSEWRDYLDIMCPELDPRDPDYTKRRANEVAETRQSIISAFHNERQATAPKSAWAAYNAVAEHIDHLPRRGASPERKAEARFNVTLFGIGRDMKKRALETACRFADLELAV